MAFGKQNNSERDYSNDVNTRGVQLHNKDGFDPSTMQVNFWNETLSIKINPALEKSKQTPTKIYDYDTTVSAALGVPKIMQLRNAIIDRILPAVEKGEEDSVGIQTGANVLVVVGTGMKQTGEIRPFFAIHRNIDPATMKPEISIAYEFNKTQTIDTYDESTGQYTTTNGIHGELMLFIKLLEAAVFGLSNANVHSDRLVNKYLNDKIVRLLEALCTKMGIDTGSNKRNSSANVFSNNSGSTNSTYTKEPDYEENVNMLDHMEDLSKYLPEE